MPAFLSAGLFLRPGSTAFTTCITGSFDGIFLNNRRGLHVIIEAVAKCKSNVELYLQGNLNTKQEKLLVDYVNKFNLVIEIMKRKHSLVNFYISKALPETIFKNNIQKQQLKDIWSYLDENSKSVLSKKLN